MTDQEFHDLLKRYLKGKTSASEEKLVEEFYKRNSEKDLFEDYSEQEEARIGKLLKTQILSSIHELEEPKRTSKSLLKIAASIVVVLGVGLALYLKHQTEPEINYLTKSTSRGQKATITLSDGSTVRLNSESSITYPETFASLESRDIKLTGEAFFDVKRNPDKPFYIKTGNLLTTVLGTSFNISDFPEDKEIEVTVATGRVAVTTNKSDSPFESGPTSRGRAVRGQEGDVHGQIKILTTGQQATFNKKSNELAINKVNIDQFTAWKDGIIYLSDAGYKQVFNKLSRWYGVEFHLINKPSGRWEYSGEFDGLNLNLVLSTIGYAGGFKYKIDGKTIEIEFNNKE